MSDVHPSADSLRLPPRPTERERPPFPLLASIAPVLVALVLWGLTHSPYMLLFAFLGPVIAVAGLADAARSTRRSTRRARAEHSSAIGLLAERVAERQQMLRRSAWRRHPTATDAFFSGPDDARRWRADEVGSVVLGTGTVPSTEELSGDADSLGAASAGEIDRERAQIVMAARFIDDMPVVVDAAAGIGVVGSEPLVRAVLRGLLLQIVDAVPPGRLALLVPAASEWDWARELPHRRADAAASAEVPTLSVHQLADDQGGAAGAAGSAGSAGPQGRVGTPGRRSDAGSRPAAVLLAGAPTVSLLPPGCGTILLVRSAVDAEIVRSVGPVAALAPTGARLVPELVGGEQAGAHARVLARHASRTAPSPLPASVAFAGPHHDGPPRSGLGGVVGVDEAGVVLLDLVGDGPHAVVGGTTGSGKSELLVTWIAAMAAGRTPAEFTFLLVDFKGGATGTLLGVLPHCVGVVTDLDAPLARRVLESLRAELRRREGVLSGAGVASIEALPAAVTLPRLVIVVDELAALLDAEAGLHALFADIAARGRSLGLHLILCTQRPAGVVREALLANCALRISLRVIDGADSTALLGIPAAAGLPSSVPGRCLISRRGRISETQIAATTRGDLAAVASRARAAGSTPGSTAGSTTPRRPWLPPLPSTLLDDDQAFVTAAEGDDPEAPTTGQAMGLLDLPSRQTQSIARWGGRALLVSGGAASGRTGLLTRIAAGAPGALVVPADVEGSWDAIERAECGGLRMLLLDDWDAVTTRWEADHRQAATERLAALLHDGVVRIAVAVRRSGAVGSLAGLFGETVVLRCDDRGEHMLAGAPAELWNPDAPPGRGVWKGADLQVLAPDALSTSLMAPGVVPPRLELGSGPVLAVSSRPDQLARRLAPLASGREIRLLEVGSRPDLVVQASGAGPVLVGRVDTWQSQPALFAALSARSTLVFDGCSTGEVRQLTRVRELAPPLRAGARRVWVQTPEGGIRRAGIDG